MGCAGSKPEEAAGVESARAGNAPTPQTQTNMEVPLAEPVILMAEPVIPMAEPVETAMVNIVDDGQAKMREAEARLREAEQRAREAEAAALFTAPDLACLLHCLQTDPLSQTGSMVADLLCSTYAWASSAGHACKAVRVLTTI